MLETLIPLLLYKSAEIILGLLLEKIWTWVLSDAHFKRNRKLLKMKLLVLYLDWILLKTSLKSIPEYPKDSNVQSI
ncbi:hypothetical protein [Calothrix sp. PCC 6303]|uniref:hypothetical protein n=1 Tax=Calothrix sp. PCC 6303 TaxID=1170562 RepID=UPI0002A035F5|nr:hypothetical protein [Calothrix sp. PCC 6303]AFZ02710.1 hypothetical protein Cal6303_3789 [Calothrix sp. PCC 6303]